MHRREFAPVPASPGEARGFVRDVLGEWGVDGEAVEDAALLVTELVTNAIIHSNSGATVEISREPGRMHFSVSDEGPGTVRLRSPGPSAITGRGIYILDRLASWWGVEDRQPGKIVRFSLDLVPDGSVPAC